MLSPVGHLAAAFIWSSDEKCDEGREKLEAHQCPPCVSRNQLKASDGLLPGGRYHAGGRPSGLFVTTCLFSSLSPSSVAESAWRLHACDSSTSSNCKPNEKENRKGALAHATRGGGFFHPTLRSCGEGPFKKPSLPVSELFAVAISERTVLALTCS